MKKGKYRKAVFVVVYAKVKNKIEYVLLKRKLHWKGWEFPKGKIEGFETKRMAVRREIKEETGLKSLKIKKFNEKGKYSYHKELKDRVGIAGQTYQLFCGEIEKGKVSIDKKEHSSCKWVSFNEGVKKLTWPNQKKCLKIVDKWLNKKK